MELTSLHSRGSALIAKLRVLYTEFILSWDLASPRQVECFTLVPVDHCFLHKYILDYPTIYMSIRPETQFVDRPVSPTRVARPEQRHIRYDTNRRIVRYSTQPYSQHHVARSHLLFIRLWQLPLRGRTVPYFILRYPKRGKGTWAGPQSAVGNLWDPTVAA